MPPSEGPQHEDCPEIRNTTRPSRVESNFLFSMFFKVGSDYRPMLFGWPNSDSEMCVCHSIPFLVMDPS